MVVLCGTTPTCMVADSLASILNCQIANVSIAFDAYLFENCIDRQTHIFMVGGKYAHPPLCLKCSLTTK